MAQVGDGLEKRDHLQRRGHTAGGKVGELVNGADVVNVAGEAHYVSPAGVGPKICLKRSHRTKRVEDLSGGG